MCGCKGLKGFDVGTGQRACDPSCLRLAKRGQPKNRQRAVRSRCLSSASAVRVTVTSDGARGLILTARQQKWGWTAGRDR